jgi:hypothetical protein
MPEKNIIELTENGNNHKFKISSKLIKNLYSKLREYV